MGTDLRARRSSFALRRGAPLRAFSPSSPTWWITAVTLLGVFFGVGSARADREPILTTTDWVTAQEGTPVTFDVTVVDPDGDPIQSLVADLGDLPPGHQATFTTSADNTRGTFAWTPAFGDGDHVFFIRFTAENARVGWTYSFVVVDEVDRPPVIEVAESVSIVERQALTLTLAATDPDGDAIDDLMADLSGLPAGANAAFTAAPDHRSGTLSWTPDYDAAPGPYSITFTAVNALSASSVTSVEVIGLDRAPIVLGPETASGIEGSALAIEISVTDPDGDPIESLVADLSSLPLDEQPVFETSPDHTWGMLTWTPRGRGSFPISFLASNGLSGTASVLVSVGGPQGPPVVSAPSLTIVDEGDPLVVEVSAFDPDSDPIASLTADLSMLPPGADVVFTPRPDRTAGTLVWNTGFEDAGDYTIGFTAANAEVGSTTIEITVAQIDRAPVVTAIDSVTLNESAPLSLTIAVSDPDGDPIHLLAADLSALPADHGAVFVPEPDRSAGTLTWTPAPHHAGGPYPVSFTASNALSSSATSLVRVIDFDRPPLLIAAERIVATENEPIAVEVETYDPDGDPIDSLTVDLSRLPPGADASFHLDPGGVSGVLSWTPGFADGGAAHEVIFTATNRLSASARTTIEVGNVDRPPVLTAPDSVVAATGEPLTLVVSASDPDGEPLESLSAELWALPAGNNATFVASADRTTGTLTWTPAQADGGVYPVTFSADNELTCLAVTNIVVQTRNRPPVASLTVSPQVTAAPMLVTADASASTDPDAPIASYRFDFGNGVVIGPQASPLASTTYTEPGVHTVVVTVTDALGAQDTAAVIVQADLGNLIVNSGLENTPIGWTSYGNATILRVRGTGRSGHYAFTVSKSFGTAWGLNDHPDCVPITAGVGRTYRVIAWVRSPSARGFAYLRVQEFLGLIGKGTVNSPRVQLSPEWQMLSADLTMKAAGTRLDIKILDDAVATDEIFYVDDVQILLLPQGDQPPVVMAPPVVTAIAGQPLAFDVRAADADGQPIDALSADLAMLPLDHAAGFTSNATRDAGTFTWTPAAAHVSPVPYLVRFAAANGLSTSLPVEIVVTDAPLANLCANPGFETNTSGWSPYVYGAAIQLVNSGRTGKFAVQVTDTAGTGWGLNDEPDIVRSTVAAGRTYRHAAWVRSTNGTGRVRMRVQEFLGTVQKGATVESPEITLGPSWQRLAVNYTVTVAGTRLDMKIVNAPGYARENFIVDDVEVKLMPSGDRPPVVTGPPPLEIFVDQPVTLSVAASDPDGDPIASLTADLSGLPAGHGAVFTPGPGNATGILSWTPGAAAVRATPYIVTFTAVNGRAATVTAVIAVTGSAPPNLVGNPGFEINTSGWGSYGAVTLARVAEAHAGGFGLQMTGRLVSMFGCDDAPNWVTTVPAAGTRYRFGAWVRSTSTTSPVGLRIYEFADGVQKGPVVYSQAIPLSDTWQYLTADYVALEAGSTLSLRVVLVPAALGESFVLDDVSIRALDASGGSLRAERAEEELAGSPPLVFGSSFFPNPMRGEGTLSLVLTRPGPVRVDLFDLGGRRVRALLDEERAEAGHHRLPVRSRAGATRLASGVYFYRVVAGEGARGGRVVIVE